MALASLGHGRCLMLDAGEVERVREVEHETSPIGSIASATFAPAGAHARGFSARRPVAGWKVRVLRAR